MPRKTKIICTLGPAVDAQEMMEGLIKAGMNVARFNFSHGDYEEQGSRIETFKKAFEVILTDNGSEFFNPMSIEKNEETEEIVSSVFYCDPEASWQKGDGVYR